MDTIRIQYCPFCGSTNIKTPTVVPRCLDCGTVFFVSYTRKLQALAKKKVKPDA